MTKPADSPYRRALDYGCFVVLLVVFSWAMVQRWLKPTEVGPFLSVGQPADLQNAAETDQPDAPAPAPLNREDVAWGIDANSATWWELTELPGIGETKARAIVAYREQFRDDFLAENPGAEPPPAFVKPQDLDHVKGIGPATVKKMRPMLRWPETTPLTADDPGR